MITLSILSPRPLSADTVCSHSSAVHGYYYTKSLPPPPAHHSDRGPNPISLVKLGLYTRLNM
ncbi:hypothetical protein BDW42DRAFT_176832 [Aspergillus taichungensis]|uniref:Uncharacterized protein n=1 Tax=Aspergillus taichungensis TaxID=482145 RepID=A0A2J5HK27_9EURO|nr:hypothetical protein BDW42DRAFT_176832 [Aspergillus taichungensis]